QRLPDHGLAAEQRRYQAGRRDLGEVRGRLRRAQADDGLLERNLAVPQRDPRPQRPGRKALVADIEMEIAHGFLGLLSRNSGSGRVAIRRRAIADDPAYSRGSGTAMSRP